MSGLSIFAWPRQRQQMCAGGPLIVAIAEQINNTKQTWDGSHWLISRQTCVVLRFAEQWVLMAPPLATHYYTSPDIAVIDDRVASHWPRGRGRGASPSYYPLPSCLQSQGWPCLMWFTVLGIILWTPLPSIMTIALLLLRPSSHKWPMLRMGPRLELTVGTYIHIQNQDPRLFSGFQKIHGSHRSVLRMTARLMLVTTAEQSTKESCGCSPWWLVPI